MSYDFLVYHSLIILIAFRCAKARLNPVYDRLHRRHPRGDTSVEVSAGRAPIVVVTNVIAIIGMATKAAAGIETEGCP